MKVTSIRVERFRNLLPQTVNLSDKLNIFVGNNAQGKTNLLESVYLCCLGKSVRTDRDRELINWSENDCYVSVNLISNKGEKNVSVALSREKKVPSVNGLPLQRIGELLGHLHCIYFSPDEIRVITASPAQRRHFLDVDLCQLNRRYFVALTRFNKALLQRNNLLKKATSIKSLQETIGIWDEQLAKEGAVLTYVRQGFCARLAPLVRQAHYTLTKTEQLDISYLQSIKGNNIDEIYENYISKLTLNLEKDFAQRFTTVGCQRDDIKFAVDEVDIRAYGSQGQQRTTALSLKLGELELFKELAGEYPVLLLDDVLSELDRTRQKALISFNPEVQIILTATKVETSLLKGLTVAKFKLKEGVATPL